MRARAKWAPIGWIVALGTGGILLSSEALSGFRSSSGGDLALTTLGTWPSLVILLAGSLTLLGLELAHVMHQRQWCARVANTSDGARAIPIGSSQDFS